MNLTGVVYYINLACIMSCVAFYSIYVDGSIDFIIPGILGMILLVMTNNFLGKNPPVMRLTIVVMSIIAVFIIVRAIPSQQSEHDETAVNMLILMLITNIICLALTIRDVLKQRQRIR